MKTEYREEVHGNCLFLSIGSKRDGGEGVISLFLSPSFTNISGALHYLSLPCAQSHNFGAANSHSRTDCLFDWLRYRGLKDRWRPGQIEERTDITTCIYHVSQVTGLSLFILFRIHRLVRDETRDSSLGLSNFKGRNLCLCLVSCSSPKDMQCHMWSCFDERFTFARNKYKYTVYSIQCHAALRDGAMDLARGQQALH